MPHSTAYLNVHPLHPEAEIIARAADVIRAGGLVAFPTETVYGLGANALDARAVERIFEAKGRPANNPIIVHVADEVGAKQLVTSWPEAAKKLAALFWPGPLTLVLPMSSLVPNIVTAGGLTVGVRVPANAIALALLQSSGVPIAAPSANRSTRISPTTAEHVRRSLDGRIDMILDGGPTTGGVESTVLDLCDDTPRILRPGLISAEQLAETLGRPIVAAERARASREPLRSPGLLERHYAPTASLECAADDGSARVNELAQSGKRIGWLRLGHKATIHSNVRVIEMPAVPAAYAARLYAALHDFDEACVDSIVVSRLPEGSDWTAIQDRLTRAAARS